MDEPRKPNSRNKCFPRFSLCCFTKAPKIGYLISPSGEITDFSRSRGAIFNSLKNREEAKHREESKTSGCIDTKFRQDATKVLFTRITVAG